MEAETSQFESSEMLAAYLASTPLLDESWRLCRDAAPQSFAIRRSGKVGYLAFSGVQSVDCSEETCRKLVELDAYAKGVFGGFCGRDGDGEPIMVHGGLLQIFSMFYRTQNFQDKVHVLLNECKSIVCTGHSLGGAVASLSALWLLSTFQAASPSTQVLCITFGSPMLGNDSFSQAILQERWGGNFCHVVGQHDIVPRVLFAPPAPIMEELRVLFQFWHLSMASPPLTQLASQQGDVWMEAATFSIHKLYKEFVGSPPRLPWAKLMCQNAAPPKFRFISWLLLHGKLATCDYMQIIGVECDPMCCFCRHEEETLDHMFFDCTFSRAIWIEVMSGYGVRRQAEKWSIEREMMLANCTSNSGRQSISMCFYDCGLPCVEGEEPTEDAGCAAIGRVDSEAMLNGDCLVLLE